MKAILPAPKVSDSNFSAVMIGTNIQPVLRWFWQNSHFTIPLKCDNASRTFAMRPKRSTRELRICLNERNLRRALNSNGGLLKGTTFGWAQTQQMGAES